MRPETRTLLDDAYEPLLYGSALQPFLWTSHQAKDVFGHDQSLHKTILLIQAPLEEVCQAFMAAQDQLLPGFSTVEIYWKKRPEDLFLLDKDLVGKLVHFGYTSYLGTHESLLQAQGIAKEHPNQLAIDEEARPVTIRQFLGVFQELLLAQLPFRTPSEMIQALFV